MSLVALILIAALTGRHAYAASTPQIVYTDNASHPVQVGTEMHFFEDEQHRLAIESVVADPDRVEWREIKQASPNFGFKDSAFWFRFNVRSDASSPKDILIELPIPFLDHVHFLRFSEGKVLEQHYVGDSFPFYQRPVTHQNFVLPFTLEPGQNQFLLRVQAEGTIEVPLSIWSQEQFLVADGGEKLLQGMWFGALAIMVIYNLLLFRLLKDISYLHYVGFAVSYLMFQGALKGYGFAYAWPDALSWNSFAISVFIAGSNLFAMLLVRSFLDLKKHSAGANKAVSILIWVMAILFIASFMAPYNATVRINSAMAMITCIVALLVGYWSWHKGNGLAKPFCLAWTSALVGIAVLVAAKFGVVPANVWTNNAGQLGVLAQVALLSFALASRFNLEKEMRIHAQESALEHERLARQSQDTLLTERAEANALLEQKVAERTENLQKAMTELESMNQKLEIMSTTDSLTGLFNRRHFEACFSEEFQLSCRHKRQLAVILCDIDHFKSINDLNGHQAGDECLQAVSATLKQRIGRSGDLVARYGGEEFIVLLNSTSSTQAAKIAEDLRSALASMNFAFQGKSIPVTASFGVSALDSEQVISADQLVTQADVALYEAKKTGRNKVVCWSAKDFSSSTNAAANENT